MFSKKYGVIDSWATCKNDQFKGQGIKCENASYIINLECKTWLVLAHVAMFARELLR